MADFDARITALETTCNFIKDDMSEIKALIKENHAGVIQRLDKYNGCIRDVELSCQRHEDAITYIKGKGAVQIAIITGICTTVCGGILLAIATRLF